MTDRFRSDYQHTRNGASLYASTADQQQREYENTLVEQLADQPYVGPEAKHAFDSYAPHTNRRQSLLCGPTALRRCANPDYSRHL